MNLIVGTHIEVGGIVARQHHWRIGTQELHLAVVAGHGHLYAWCSLDGDILKLGIDNLARCRRTPFQEIGLSGLYGMHRLEVKCNHTCLGVIACRGNIVAIVRQIHLVDFSSLQRTDINILTDDVEGQTNGVPHMVLVKLMSVEHYFLDGSALVLFDEGLVVFCFVKDKFGRRLGYRLLTKVIDLFPCRTVELHINLATGQCHIGRGRTEHILVAFLAEAIDVLTALDSTIGNPQLVIATHVGIVGSGQWNMMHGTCLVRMNDENITHRNFLDRIQDDIIVLVINTDQLKGIDTQQR